MNSVTARGLLEHYLGMYLRKPWRISAMIANILAENWTRDLQN